MRFIVTKRYDRYAISVRDPVEHYYIPLLDMNVCYDTLENAERIRMALETLDIPLKPGPIADKFSGTKDPTHDK